jgi:hypothetical protein
MLLVSDDPYLQLKQAQHPRFAITSNQLSSPGRTKKKRYHHATQKGNGALVARVLAKSTLEVACWKRNAPETSFSNFTVRDGRLKLQM